MVRNRLDQPRMAQPSSKLKTFFERLFSTVVLWVVVTLVFKSQSPWAYAGLAGILALIAYDEILRMGARWIEAPARVWWRIAGITTVVSLWCLYGLEKFALPGFELVALSLAVLGAFAVAMRQTPDAEKTLQEVCLPLIAFVLAPLLFMGGATRLMFDLPGDGNIPGAWYLLFVIAVTKFSDMGAYATGSLIGKHKMIPHISPGKTWQGFFGAIVFAGGIGAVLYGLFPEKLSLLTSWVHVVVLGVLLSVVAVVGDLVESVIKRCLGVKDSGKFLPGIGGGFDLIDSMCFTFPVLWGYMKFFLLADS